ncbi:hypothetical protein VN21_10685 [Paraclostridium benzoelyticum]|uniref:Uncharacterized protein n=1 Tax=Paraclostridium benzoelyticum TaxID=1629550 RepID=A0A0M3DFN3_9FIRM|nr:hypothetical protein VN21_10685 [Paraclostridium benzoelyticum]
MEFHYYYLIQDFLGVLLCFLGIIMVYLCLKMIFIRNFSKNAMLFLIKYSLFIISGVNLLSNHFELKPWILSMILVITSFIVTPKQRIL